MKYYYYAIIDITNMICDKAETKEVSFMTIKPVT